jgi:hypothetical protein
LRQAKKSSLPATSDFEPKCYRQETYDSKQKARYCCRQRAFREIQAERAGFEPAVRCDPHTAFPVPHLRPLGHLSERTQVILSMREIYRLAKRSISPLLVLPAGINPFRKDYIIAPAQPND